MLATRLAAFGNFNYDSTSRACTAYMGANAVREYNALAGCTVDSPPPMQNPGCGHWDEPCFLNEVMTPFISGASNPFSRLTIGAMEDVGYVVDYSQADTYTSANMNLANCPCNSRRLGANNSTVASSSSSSFSEPKRRRLSDEGYEAATAYGRAELERINSGLEGSDIALPAMAVLYQDEDGSMHSVVVSA